MWSGQERRVTDRSGEMVELKDAQQQEMEGKPLFHP